MVRHADNLNLKLDIQIPTPQISEVGDESDDGKAHEGNASQQAAEQSAAQ
jgi:hypothetical protein